MTAVRHRRSGLIQALGVITGVIVVNAASAVDLSREQRIEILNEALRAFDRGTQMRQSQPSAARHHFEEAAQKFQLLVDSGIRNGKLFYNLGNAYLQSEQLGRAILNYRRAEKLIPNDPQLEANLKFARSLRQSRIPPSGETAFLRTFFAWHYGTPLRARWRLGLAAYVLFWTLLILRLYWKNVRWSFALAAVLVLCLSLVASAAYELSIQRQHSEGVIVADDVIVRKGNGRGFEPQFEQPLHQGVEFSLREQRRNWMKIELPDGNTGWIPSSKAELIRMS